MTKPVLSYVLAHGSATSLVRAKQGSVHSFIQLQYGFCCHCWWEPPKSDPGLPLSTGIAVALHQAMTPEFKAYQQQVVANCKALSSALMEMGYDIVTGEDTAVGWG